MQGKVSMTVFRKLKQLDLPNGQYAVFGSTPMSVRGLRKSRDLDILVSKDIFDKYKKMPGWGVKKLSSGDEGLENGKVEMFYTLGTEELDGREVIEGAEIIEGFCFARLEKILAWKKAMNREKDQKDIALLKDYLKTK